MLYLPRKPQSSTSASVLSNTISFVSLFCLFPEISTRGSSGSSTAAAARIQPLSTQTRQLVALAWLRSGSIQAIVVNDRRIRIRIRLLICLENITTLRAAVDFLLAHCRLRAIACTPRPSFVHFGVLRDGSRGHFISPIRSPPFVDGPVTSQEKSLSTAPHILRSHLGRPADRRLTGGIGTIPLTEQVG